MTSRPRPNILWLISDQHNARCMGHEGRNVRTPNLDWIAHSGARFTQAFCNNPICAPSRTSFITGQYCHTHRHLGNGLIDYPEGNPDTLSAVARRHGYQTALIGKAHMIRQWDEQGFEHIRYCDLCDAQRNDPLTCHYFKHLVDNDLAGLYDQGTLPADHPGKRTHWFISPIPHEHSLEVWTGNETLAFLQGRDTRRPFFLQMSFQRPHAPLSPSFERKDMYRPEDIDIPASARDVFENAFATKPEWQRRHIANRATYPYVPADRHELQTQLTHYYALISIIDEQIGRVLEHLRSSGELENTVVVYVADHGDFGGDHGLVHKNFGIYESIHRIPFLLAYPGCPAGTVTDEIVESVDLYPTLCDLMDVPTPSRVEGASLLPILEQGAGGRDSAICEWGWLPPREMIHAIRTREFRLVYYGSGQEGELYDHSTDPDELVNVYSDPEYLQIRLQLTEQLLDRVAQYEKRSGPGSEYTARQARTSRNSMTELIHKRSVNWTELEQYYRPVGGKQ